MKLILLNLPLRELQALVNQRQQVLTYQQTEQGQEPLRIELRVAEHLPKAPPNRREPEEKW